MLTANSLPVQSSHTIKQFTNKNSVILISPFSETHFTTVDHSYTALGVIHILWNTKLCWSKFPKNY